MAFNLPPLYKQHFFDDNGNPLNGGQFLSFVAGSQTPADTFTSISGTVKNANPIVLNSRGESDTDIWLSDDIVYKFQLLNSLGTEIWTVDNVSAAGTGAGSSSAEVTSCDFKYVFKGSFTDPDPSTIVLAAGEWALHDPAGSVKIPVFHPFDKDGIGLSSYFVDMTDTSVVVIRTENNSDNVFSVNIDAGTVLSSGNFLFSYGSTALGVALIDVFGGSIGDVCCVGFSQRSLDIPTSVHFVRNQTELQDASSAITGSNSGIIICSNEFTCTDLAMGGEGTAVVSGNRLVFNGDSTFITSFANGADRRFHNDIVFAQSGVGSIAIQNEYALFFKNVTLFNTLTITDTGLFRYERVNDDSFFAGNTVLLKNGFWDNTAWGFKSIYVETSKQLLRALNETPAYTHIYVGDSGITVPDSTINYTGGVQVGIYGGPITFSATPLTFATSDFSEDLRFYNDETNFAANAVVTGPDVGQDFKFRNSTQTGAATFNTMNVEFEKVRGGGTLAATGTGVVSKVFWDNTAEENMSSGISGQLNVGDGAGEFFDVRDYYITDEPSFRAAALATVGTVFEIKKITPVNIESLTLDDTPYIFNTHPTAPTILFGPFHHFTFVLGTSIGTHTFDAVNDPTVGLYFLGNIVEFSGSGEKFVVNKMNLRINHLRENLAAIDEGAGSGGLQYRTLETTAANAGTMIRAKVDWRFDTAGTSSVSSAADFINSTRTSLVSNDSPINQIVDVTVPITVPNTILNFTLDSAVEEVNKYRGNKITFTGPTLDFRWTPGIHFVDFENDIDIDAIDTWEIDAGNTVRCRNIYTTSVTTIDEGTLQYERIIGGGSFVNGTGGALAQQFKWDDTSEAMTFRGAWVPGQYWKNDVVRDGNFLMSANKDTQDKAAPQPDGVEREIPATNPNFTIQNVVASFVMTGLQLTTPVDEGAFVFSLEIYIPTIGPNINYIVAVQVDANVPIFGPSFNPTLTGWQGYPIDDALIGNGVQLRVMLLAEDTTSTNTFNYLWDYNTPNNANSTPSPGQIVQPNNAPDIMRVHKFDNGGTDRSTDLANITIGSTQAALGITWLIEEAADSGPFFTFRVSPVIQAAPDGVTTFTFVYTVPVSVDFVEELTFWIDPAIRGITQVDGITSPTVSDTVYGVRLGYEEAIVSEDWDFILASEGTISGGTNNSAILNGELSTSVIKGGIITQNANPVLIDISAGNGRVVDFADPNNPIVTPVIWDAQIGVAMPDIVGDTFTAFSFDDTGALLKAGQTPITPTLRRQEIIIGTTVHVETTIEDIIQGQVMSYNTVQALLDWVAASGGVVNGSAISTPNANLTFAQATGTFTRPFINASNNLDPSTKTNGAVDPKPFNYQFQDGAGDFTTVLEGTSIDPDQFDDGTGVLASMPSNDWQWQPVFYFGSFNRIAIFYGQFTYNNKSDAISGIAEDFDDFIANPQVTASAKLLGFFVVRDGATDLTNSTTSEYLSVTGLALSGGGVGGGGDVSSSVSTAIDNAIVKADGTTGKLVQFASTYVVVDNAADVLAALADSNVSLIYIDADADTGIVISAGTIPVEGKKLIQGAPLNYLTAISWTTTTSFSIKHENSVILTGANGTWNVAAASIIKLTNVEFAVTLTIDNALLEYELIRGGGSIVAGTGGAANTNWKNTILIPAATSDDTFKVRFYLDGLVGNSFLYKLEQESTNVIAYPVDEDLQLIGISVGVDAWATLNGTSTTVVQVKQFAMDGTNTTPITTSTGSNTATGTLNFPNSSSSTRYEIAERTTVNVQVDGSTTEQGVFVFVSTTNPTTSTDGFVILTFKRNT